MADSESNRDAPLRGADPVNDELEVGFDQKFEESWHRAERGGRVVMGLFLIAALGGFLGRGPFSHHTSTAADHSMAVDYEPVARVNTPTQVTFHIDNKSDSPDLDLLVGTQVVEPMGLMRVIPQPVEERAAGGGLLLRVAIPPGTHNAHVRLVLQPGGVGRVEEHASLSGHAVLRWSQVVMP